MGVADEGAAAELGGVAGLGAFLGLLGDGGLEVGGDGTALVGVRLDVAAKEGRRGGKGGGQGGREVSEGRKDDKKR